MFTGFEKIVEQRILDAQRKGEFEDLPGSGEPLSLTEDHNIPEELRLAYKMLKNADCLPPEIELKKKIRQTEELLAGMEDTAEKYHTLKKLNFMIMRLNAMGNRAIEFEVPQQYTGKLVQKLDKHRPAGKKR